MLKIDNFHATVGGKPILNGLSLTVPASEELMNLPSAFALERSVG